MTTQLHATAAECVDAGHRGACLVPCSKCGSTAGIAGFNDTEQWCSDCWVPSE